MTNDAILQRLKELTEGLYYMSEGDYPLEVVHHDIAESTELSDTEVKQMAGHSCDANAETVDLAYFLRNMTKTQPDADDAAKQIAKRYQMLQAYMEQQLSDVVVYRVGRRKVVAVAIGLLPEGGYGGFKTTVIET